MLRRLSQMLRRLSQMLRRLSQMLRRLPQMLRRQLSFTALRFNVEVQWVESQNVEKNLNLELISRGN
jgi:hypothetical protein